MSAAALIIFTIVLFPCAAHAGGKALNVIYTGAIKGELEPCGCSPETQSGGLARLSGYISANKKALSPYVLVDAGNAFAEATAQGRLKSEAIIRSFALMGYDAAAVNVNRAAVDGGFISALASQYRVPVPPSNRAIKAIRNGLKINISSDEKLAKKGMINILLSGKQVSELKAVKGWDVIISSFGEELDEPVASGKALIVSGFPKGQKLGILSLKLDGKGKVVGSSHRWQALKQDVAEDPEVRSVLKDYDQKVAALLKEEELKPVKGGPYLGSESCVECHQSYVDSWKATKHSAAFATLERVGKSKDPECVKCHVVGFGEEGGFLSLKATPGLANVQCESCHGPGREHAADFSPMRPIGIEVCLKCHTHENSPLFDYQKYFEKIKH
ncbi:MAG: hypothetical protein HYV23_00175 [Deltaproteobacteria bacterium]|nr:hypothetical protein [Deltaproteobacteria bacterium]